MTVAHDTLYRCYTHDGQLLYIGITSDMSKRIKCHLTDSRGWWPLVAHIETEQVDPVEARHVEREAIRNERPAFNKAHNGGWSATRARPIV